MPREQNVGAAGGGSEVWTSAVSVKEQVLLARLGYEPLDAVLGYALQPAPLLLMGGSDGLEMWEVNRALQQAFAQARERMVSDARRAGAAGIVEIELAVSRHADGGRMLECWMRGTAVRARSPVRGGSFFTTTLSGREAWVLSQAGYQPQALVFASSVWYVGRPGLGTWLRRLTSNIEIAAPTQAVYTAREQVVARLQEDAVHAGAAGIVGIDLVLQERAWGCNTIQLLATGNAIAPRDGIPTLPEPALVVGTER